MARTSAMTSRSATATPPSTPTAGPPQAWKKRKPSGQRRRSRSSSGSGSSTSMALTASSAAVERHIMSRASAAPTEESFTLEAVSIPLRKRARQHSADNRSAESDFLVHTRSPSAIAITTTTTTASNTAGASSALQDRRRPRLSGDSSSPRQRPSVEETDEVFVGAFSPTTSRCSGGGGSGAHTPRLHHLQGTPTSQLLSQLQDQPYTAQSEEKADEVVAAALFTPVTVPRRRGPLAVAGEPAAVAATAAVTPSLLSPSASGSRSSVHDEAVQAILRANPPTTTRAVELKPGYRVPSPRSPLWAALDAEDGEGGSTAGRRTTRGSGRSVDVAPWINTQVSLFSDGAEEDEGTAAAPNTAPALTATQERRRLGSRRAPQDRLSLPAAGRSVNLLDEDGDDTRPALFVGEAAESGVISLTQEACEQERVQDLQAALPRSRNRRASPAADAATKRSSVTSLASPPRHNAAARPRASHQASPFSQLQRDVQRASAVAAAASSATPRSSASPLNAGSVALSQRELRRRADMLKWAERTRAFFHFIDSLPLHVSNSPLKPTAPAASALPQSRRSRSQTIAASGAAAAARPHTPAAASMSLVRRSRSAVAPPSTTAAAGRSGSSAFEAVVSRVKREAAAAAVLQRQSHVTDRHRSATAASCTSPL